VPLLLQTTLGGGVGRLKLEALREEVHRFDAVIYTPTTNHFLLLMLHCTHARTASRKDRERSMAGLDRRQWTSTQKRPHHERASSSFKE
jgi:hypothetical protein